jgi:hypothetical protein
MAKDFRELLVESSRHEQFGRFFRELAVGFKVVLSFQASETHACEPAETLDDIYAYTKWEVSLRQVDKPIDVPKIGAWNAFLDKEWAAPFDRPEFQRAMVGEFIPTEHCQRILEDVIEYAISKDQLESEDDITVVDPEVNLKRAGCGGCGSKKPDAGKPAPKAAE